MRSRWAVVAAVVLTAGLLSLPVAGQRLSQYPWALLDGGAYVGPVYNLSCGNGLACGADAGNGYVSVTSAPYAASCGSCGNALSALTALFAQDAGQALLAGFATYAADAGLASRSSRSDFADDAGRSLISNFSDFAWDAGYSQSAGLAGVATYALDAGLAGRAYAADFASDAGFADLANLAASAQVASLATFALDAGQAGRAAVADFARDAGSAASADLATAALWAGDAGYSTNAGAAALATYALDAGLAGKAAVADFARDAGSAASADLATAALWAGDAGYSLNAGAAALATYALDAGLAGKALAADFARDAGSAANADFARDAGSAANADFARDAGSAASADVSTFALDAGRAVFAGFAADAGLAVAALWAGDAGYSLNAAAAALATYALDAGQLQCVGCITEGKLGAGAVTPAKLATGVNYGAQPLNGDFSSWTAGATSPPDGWTVGSGTWGTDIARSASTPYSLSLPHTATSGTLTSGLLRIQGDALTLQVRVYGSDNGTTAYVTDYGARLDWYDSTSALLSSSSFFIKSVSTLTGGSRNVDATATPPAGAVYFRAVVGRLARNRTVAGTIELVEVQPVAVLADASVGTAQLAGSAVTSAKLATNIDVAGQLTTGGNLGVGIASPAARLHVAAAATTAPSLTWGASAGQILRSENSELALGLSNASPFPLYMQGRTSANAARDLALQPLGGNIGVGTSSPGNAITVSRAASSAAYVQTLSGTNSSLFGNGAGGETIAGSFSAQPLLLYSNSAERLRLDTAGAVYTPTAGSLGVGNGRWTTNGNDIFLNTNGSSVIYLRPGGSGSTNWQYEASSASTYHRWLGASGAELMRVNGTALGVFVSSIPSGNSRLFVGGDMTMTSGLGLLANTYFSGSNFFYVNSAAAAALSMSSGAFTFQTAPSGTAGGTATMTTRLTVQNGGNVTVANLAGTGNRAVYSDASGNLTNSSSDATLKTAVEDLRAPLRLALALRPVSFNWKDVPRFGPQREVGFLAQEVMQVVPEVVGRNNDGTYTLDYAKLVAVVVGAVQELYEDRTWLARRVQELEDRAQRAEDKLAQLEARLAALEAR